MALIVAGLNGRGTSLPRYFNKGDGILSRSARCAWRSECPSTAKTRAGEMRYHALRCVCMATVPTIRNAGESALRVNFPRASNHLLTGNVIPFSDLVAWRTPMVKECHFLT